MEKSVKQIVSEYLEEIGVSQNQFEKACGFSKGYFYRFPASPTMDKVEIMLSVFPGLKERLKQRYLSPGKQESQKEEREYTELPKQKEKPRVTSRKKEKPRVPIEVAAGLPGGLYECVRRSECELMPVINQFPRYDMTIFIKGDSMYPNYQSGDELAIKRVYDYIEWGKVYVLDTTEGAVIKRLYDDGEHYICKSFNPDYPDFKVSKESVLGIYKVVGLLRV